MGNETIFYYVTEESLTGAKRIIKPRFGRKIKLTSFVVETEEAAIVAVFIPMLQKGWRSDKLLRLMQKTREEYALYDRNAEIMIQPAVWSLLADDMKAQEEPVFLSVFWRLSAKLLWNASGLCVESVILLLSPSLFPEEQIERFSELMQPYFSYVNHFTVVYPEEDETEKELEEPFSKMEAAYLQEADWTENNSFDLEESRRGWEAVETYLQNLYYEYGLVSQVLQSREVRLSRFHRRSGNGSTLFLDFGYNGAIPFRVMQTGGIYLDVASSDKKRTAIQKKCSRVSYLSPRKYLDTLVKSGYDKLVNQAY